MLSVEPLLAEPREVSRTRVTAFHVQAPRHLRLHRSTRQHPDHDVPREPAHLGRRPREPPVHIGGDMGELRRVDQLRRHTVSKSKHHAPTAFRTVSKSAGASSSSHRAYTSRSRSMLPADAIPVSSVGSCRCSTITRSSHRYRPVIRPKSYHT